MIELLRIRIQYLNGENIIEEQRLLAKKTFRDEQKLEDYRKLKEMKLQYKQDLKGKGVKVEVIFNRREL
ncbi:MAG: hypothetical protein M0P47_09435 [Bacteroidales bacterium]|nr:hypothetical protein [Bacteroidales bacterium]